MRTSSVGLGQQLRARPVSDKLRHMAGRASGYGMFLLFALTACAGHSVTPAGDAAAQMPAENEQPCTGATVPRTLFGEYENGFAVADDQVVIAAGDGIRRVPLAGGDSVLLTSSSDPTGPLVLNGNAYFSTSHPIGDPIGGKQPTVEAIDAVPVAGGEETTVLDSDASLLDNTAVDATSLYLDDLGQGLQRFTPPSSTTLLAPLPDAAIIDAVAQYGDFVYVATQSALLGMTGAGEIVRLPKNGGAAQVIVSGIGQPWSLVADDTGLYWQEDLVGDYGAGHIAHAKLDGSGVSSILDNISASSLALHAGRLYFSNGATISSIPVTGGTPTTIVSGQKDAGALAIAGENLLWIDPAQRALSDPTVPALLTACIPQ